MEIQGYNFPNDLYYDDDHFWLRQENDILVMGMDDFGQHLAGDIVFIQLPNDGKKIVQGEVFSKLESGKWMGKIKSYVNGTITEINEDLEIEPTKINEDPYNEGWMFKIKCDDITALNNLHHGDKIKPWIESEIEKYKEK